MDVRLGYVAMSVNVVNASPSKTMTAKQFALIADREAGLRKLERIAKENLHNCTRLLYHNRAYDITFFRLSSRLIPLVGHEMTEGWEYRAHLAEAFHELGEIAIKDGVRIDFHPDHYVVLNTPRRQTLDASLAALDHHIWMLKALGIRPVHRCVLHVGGTYKDKEKAACQFIDNWSLVPEEIKSCVLLENDDKVFTAKDTLELCETLGIPMVLDIHHHRCNHAGEEEEVYDLLPRIIATWRTSPLPPKMHISSPRSEKDVRAHADYIEPEDLFPFLRRIVPYTERLDVMIEAKQKDDALLRLMEWVRNNGEPEGIRALNGASFQLA
ncbi:UV DNA damage repair endonuclease UvsE [Aneurinibacillus sp. BA2021]|nr:UV DNA damage repair endonuclease UvsE [Aneurinibacillus sp. BA2021]